LRVGIATVKLFDMIKSPPKTNYHVFACYNSHDRRAVREIVNRLVSVGIHVWFDRKELPPGSVWKRCLFGQIAITPCALIFIGPNACGPWQGQELSAIQDQFVMGKIRVIPVFLSGAGTKISLPPDVEYFLNQFTRVDFDGSSPEPFSDLAWGIRNSASPTGLQNERPTAPRFWYSLGAVALLAASLLSPTNHSLFPMEVALDLNRYSKTSDGGPSPLSIESKSRGESPRTTDSVPLPAIENGDQNFTQTQPHAGLGAPAGTSIASPPTTATQQEDLAKIERHAAAGPTMRSAPEPPKSLASRRFLASDPYLVW
jgi:hypothetical protein